MVRTLAELTHPVGVFFENGSFFPEKDDSQMALSLQAAMAREESHISMETSLRMRLDGGLPVTPGSGGIPMMQTENWSLAVRSSFSSISMVTQLRKSRRL